ncbi:MAG: FixH family protein [Chitinophagaceae bacterium]|jgi:hypothetical protein|nr:FixH family protein [Chitinophagaceae bacterium]MCE2972145.1 FixH family protein [Sediminibacterium sp.]MCA6466714.1 FixH family protein [Chitinophagaceae bacterium]MCA6469216.1 FixH family protein [Chitinophagaceae bacterium]MCA6474145.1 FixH family protein [Chitinophagaceae bacterium]
MNWGRALLLVFVLFAGFMGYLVYRASGTHFDLVSKEYYRDELNYQDKIDGLRRAADISKVIIKTEGNRQLLVELPAELSGKSISGELWLYCKTNAALDVKLPLKSDTALVRSFDLSAHPAGKYIVKLHWEADQLKYDSEQEINLP